MDDRIAKIREDYLQYLTKVLTKEQHERACKYLRDLSEQDLMMFFAELRERSKPYDNLTEKEKLLNLRQIHEEMKKNNEEPAWIHLDTKFLSEDKNQYFLSIINDSHVQDIIHLTNKEDHFLIDLWEGKQNWDLDFKGGETRGKINIPSDLFFAKTIPLKDCLIEIDERNDFPNGKICRARVICFPYFEEIVDLACKERSEKYNDVGIIVMYLEDNPMLFCVFGICEGVDVLIFRTEIGVFPGVTIKNNNVTQGLFDGVVSFLETWYGIQIALLHPDVKAVFRNPQRVKELKNANSKKKNEKRRKVKYVRKHILELSELEKSAHTNEASKYKRRCLVWYVIGHWRKYKSGKKVFIKPFWKGVLRNVKSASDVEPRDRELTFDSEYFGDKAVGEEL